MGRLCQRNISWISQRNLSEEKNNFLHMMEAIALRTLATENKVGDVMKEFATVSNVTLNDYKIV